MRIISGKYKGRIIAPPRNLRARPTTDFAKENLFNVLAGFGFDYAECDVLDLFAGTGSVSYEFASRGVRSVTAVEINAVHYAFIRRTATELGFVSRESRGAGSPPVDGGVPLPSEANRRAESTEHRSAAYEGQRSERGGFFPVKANVFNYLRACTRQFDIVFSDAPYDLAGSEEVIPIVFERGLLKDGGVLIFEHSKGHDFSAHPHFMQTRSYGSVQFTFFCADK